MKLRDRQRLLDVLKAADLVASFTDGISFDKFKEDELVQSAVLRQIQIVGEACRMLSPEIRDSAADIPWSRIIGMRHILVHGYNIIDLELVWSVVQTFLPQAQESVEGLLKRYDIQRPS